LTKQLPVRRYASAGGVVVADTGEHVLVLCRRDRLGPRGRAELRLPKGHIEPDEDPRQTALREVGEEAGLSPLNTIRDLGQQVVEFNWRGYHYIRHESCFLMTTLPSTKFFEPEEQFERIWLLWHDALAQLTFAAEREWVRRAQSAWATHSKNITEQYPKEADNNPQVQK
jgi:8-oxo-dGTP pyrophosphatase MutT (NUDIX family)